MRRPSWAGAKASLQTVPLFVRIVATADAHTHKKNQSSIQLDLVLFLTRNRKTKLVPESTSMITPTSAKVLKFIDFNNLTPLYARVENGEKVWCYRSYKIVEHVYCTGRIAG
jgi:hypothetical protein